jgi:hypothetical protein
MSWRAIFRPGMRAYWLPFGAGLFLAASAFLPWVTLGDESLMGFPDMAALWIVGLGLLASLLAMLSMITRKNSRHPLLLVGLVALGIDVLSWRIAPRTVEERARVRSQAVAIVEHTEMTATPAASAGAGLYLGLVASALVTAFGLTIVVKRVSTTYAVVDQNDDVD